MTIRIASNISSLQAQRQLAKAGSALTSTYEKLSSGMRINRPSDDAAGLSIASQLNSSGRVFTQAIRNVNDGISMANIADGALSSLSNITSRQQELAEQAANGTYSAKQRLALNAEATALTDEYNRIIKTTEFNGTKIFAQSDSKVWIQAGVGAPNAISLSFTEALQRSVGSGNFGSGVSAVSGAQYSIAAADFNNDGFLDLVSSAGVYLNNGSGGFVLTTSLANSGESIVGDFNGDGILDLLRSDTRNSLFLGKGDGTFQASLSTNITQGGSLFYSVGDLNGDGISDVITSSGSFLGSKSGTFTAGPALTGKINNAAVGDINSDGIADIVLADYEGSVRIYLGSGGGAFAQIQQVPTDDNTKDVKLADLDGDGILDLIVGFKEPPGNGVAIYHGTGTGSFSLIQSFSGDYDTHNINVVDLNGDGRSDFVTTGANGTFSFLNDGKGKFNVNSATGIGAFSVSGDFNNDGANDLVTSDGQLSLGIKTQSTQTAYLDLTTQNGARSAITFLSASLDRIHQQQATLGAGMSRFSYASATLQAARENYAAAESRIVDVDIAKESAELNRLQILQNVAASVLAQANQAPALALKLLS